MPRRSSSLNNLTGSGITREIDSKYDVIKNVSLHLADIESIATEDLVALKASLDQAKDFTGITVVAGVSASWDDVNKILTVPTLKGDQGIQGIQGEQGIIGPTGPKGVKGDQGVQGEQGIQGAPGTRGIQGIQGEQGLKGDTGPQGLQGDQGPVGPRGLTGEAGIDGEHGVSVHHIKGTSTTDLEGDFATPGERDTYTIYGNADETLNLGYFVVTNGLASDEVGLMYKSTYDLDGSGVVDNSEALGGKSLATVESERDAAILAAQLALGTNYTVADLAAKDALTDLTVGDKVFVQDDGDGKWAQYWVVAVTDGGGASSTFEVVMDKDTYLNANTATGIKSTYESNADTNAFTDVEKTSVDVATALDTTASTLPSSINEVHSELDAEVATAVAHRASTSVHGVTEVVGAVEAQSLTNKTIADKSNTVHANVVYQRAKATENVLKGQPVVITGYNVGESALNVALADHTTGVATGLALEDIGVGLFGSIISTGVLNGVDTTGSGLSQGGAESWSEGDVLYVNGSGFLTNVEPQIGFAQPIAYILGSNAINGALQINADYSKQNADDVRYVDSYAATSDVQTGVQAVEGRLDTVEGRISTVEGDATRSGDSVTLSGDVSGTTTVGADGSIAVLTVVADDSHNHVISNVDGLQAALDSKLDDTQLDAATALGMDDLKVPTQRAVKVYVDNVASNQNEASEIGYTNTTSSLLAVNVQSAIDEVEGRVDTLEGETTKSGDSVSFSGDVTGSSTVAADGSITTVLTVVDDSHSHIISNVDGLQVALDSKVDDSQISTATTLGISDVLVPSQNAVKVYVDAAVETKDTAVEIAYSNTTSGLVATNTQSAIDEVEGRVDTAETKLAGIEDNATADQTKADIDALGIDAATVNSLTVETAVPVGAVFTDTTYTNTEIKTKYEANTNTNAFTDAEKTKLAGIEDGATADQTKADIDALNIDADTLDGKQGVDYETNALVMAIALG
jgi:hypothetical protein